MQFNSQSSSVSPQVGLGLGVQAPGLSTVTSAAIQQQPGSIHQQPNQQALLSTGPKDAGTLKLLMSVCFNFWGMVLVLGTVSLLLLPGKLQELEVATAPHPFILKRILVSGCNFLYPSDLSYKSRTNVTFNLACKWG